MLTMLKNYSYVFKKDDTNYKILRKKIVITDTLLYNEIENLYYLHKYWCHQIFVYF